MLGKVDEAYRSFQ